MNTEKKARAIKRGHQQEKEARRPGLLLKKLIFHRFRCAWPLRVTAAIADEGG
jgi:hypothetical protein